MIVEVYSKHTEKQKKKSSVVKPPNNKAASTRESKKSANKIATTIVILIYYSNKLLRNALCKFITDNLTNISNVCIYFCGIFRLARLLISNMCSIVN